MRNIVFYWAVTTVALCTGYVYVRTMQPDELVMANSLGFQVLVSLLIVGGPSLLVLFLMLFVGALIRRRRSNLSLQGTRDTAARP